MMNKKMNSISRRDFINAVIAAAGSASLTGCGTDGMSDRFAMEAAATDKATAGKSKYPNIVLILADDLGYGDLSCLNSRSKIRTPHIDRMASEGMTFTDAHAASSVCTPSRYSILLGRYCWRGRLHHGVIWPFHTPLMETDRMTLPEFLKENGYNTACIGKWHLGWNWPLKTEKNPNQYGWKKNDDHVRISFDVDYIKPIKGGPTDRGFDYYFGVDVPNFPPYSYIENDRILEVPTVKKIDSMFGVPGAMLKGWDLQTIMPTLTEKSVKYIEQQSKAEKPFFLYMSLTAPHTPIVPTEEFQGKSSAGVYGDFVMQVDDTVGRINHALSRMGITDDTLVILTSDNGSPMRDGSFATPGTVRERFGHNSSSYFRGMKGDAWDGGHRVPFIAKWPQKVTPGTTCDQLICLMDLMATCGAVIDKKMPENAAPDSLNILSYLMGEKMKKPIRNELVHNSATGVYALRSGDWKLIMDRGSGGFTPDEPIGSYDPPGQLYNLKDDPSEQNNLYFERPDIVRPMMLRLTDYRTAELAGVKMQ